MRKLLLVLLFLPLLTLAQSNYKAGHVVTLKGDTLHGYIDYRDWGYNPKTISFKADLNDKVQPFAAADITFFELDGYVSYHAYKVIISLNPVDISSPVSLLDTAKLTDTVFLKTLQKGENVTLYSYRDKLKERFYIQDNTMDAPAELIYGIYQDPNNPANVVSKNIYQNQLSLLAAKYNTSPDKLNKQIQQSEYKEDNLVPVVAGINGSSTPVSLKSSNPIFRLFAGTAFTSNTVKYSGQIPFYGSEPCTSSTPKISAGIDVFTNPDIGRLIFRLEFGYEVNNYTFYEKPIVPDPENPITSAIKIKQNIILITPQVIYNIYNSAALKVFIDLGYAVGVVKYPSQEFVTYQNNKVAGSSKLLYDTGFNDTFSGCQFKAGVVISKKFEIYGAYSPGATLTHSVTYEANQSSYQAGVNYYFGKVAH